MITVLIVSPRDLAPDLGETVLWRKGINRVFEAGGERGLEAARRLAPRLVVLDTADAEALGFLKRLRLDGSTRQCSVAVLGRAGSVDEERELREAGANLVLSGAADPALWDGRLEELLSVPGRREVRIPVVFETWAAPEGAQPLEGRALNLSVRGLLLETDEPLDIATRLELRFALPRRGGDVRVVGRVVREAQAAQPRRYGVEFLILRDDARDRIRAFVGLPPN